MLNNNSYAMFLHSLGLILLQIQKMIRIIKYKLKQYRVWKRKL